MTQNTTEKNIGDHLASLIREMQTSVLRTTDKKPGSCCEADAEEIEDDGGERIEKNTQT